MSAPRQTTVREPEWVVFYGKDLYAENDVLYRFDRLSIPGAAVLLNVLLRLNSLGQGRLGVALELLARASQPGLQNKEPLSDSCLYNQLDASILPFVTSGPGTWEKEKGMNITWRYEPCVAFTLFRPLVYMQ